MVKGEGFKMRKKVSILISLLFISLNSYADNHVTSGLGLEQPVVVEVPTDLKKPTYDVLKTALEQELANYTFVAPAPSLSPEPESKQDAGDTLTSNTIIENQSAPQSSPQQQSNWIMDIREKGYLSYLNMIKMLSVGESDPEQSYFAMGTLIGVVQGTQFTNADFTRVSGVALYCVPENLVITPNIALKLMTELTAVLSAEQASVFGDFPVALMYLRTLEYSFPCAVATPEE